MTLAAGVVDRDGALALARAVRVNSQLTSLSVIAQQGADEASVALLDAVASAPLMRELRLNLELGSSFGAITD